MNVLYIDVVMSKFVGYTRQVSTHLAVDTVHISNRNHSSDWLLLALVRWVYLLVQLCLVSLLQYRRLPSDIPLSARAKLGLETSGLALFPQYSGIARRWLNLAL